MVRAHLVLLLALTLVVGGCAEAGRPTAGSPYWSPPFTPPAVALVNGTSSNDALFLGQFCGGVAISADRVVTAEHCLPKRSANGVDVVLGVDDLCASAGVATIRSKTLAIDHGVGPGGTLAVLHLAELLPVSAYVDASPIERQRGDAVAVGWGRSSPHGVPPCRMHQIALSSVPASECQTHFYPLATADVLCTVPAEGTNSCDGDSGGPVFAFEEQRLVDVAVIMAGWGCGPDDLGINVRIPRSMWLEAAPLPH